MRAVRILRAAAARVERACASAGRALAWTFALLAGAIVLQVVLRYVFSRPTVAFNELQWYLSALIVMASLSYAQCTGAHIRVDLLYDRFPPGVRRAVDAAATACLLLPLCAFLAWQGWTFAADSYALGEGSSNPGGLPYRWLVKGAIPAGAALLFLAGLARLILPGGAAPRRDVAGGAGGGDHTAPGAPGGSGGPSGTGGTPS